MSTNGWISKAVADKGGLHRSLGVPSGDIIPQSKIMKATHANNPKVYGEKLIHQGDADHPIELVVRHIGAREPVTIEAQRAPELPGK